MTRSWQFFVEPDVINSQVTAAGGIDKYIDTFNDVYGEKVLDVTWLELVKIDSTILMRHGDKLDDRTWDLLGDFGKPEWFTDEICAKYRFERI